MAKAIKNKSPRNSKTKVAEAVEVGKLEVVDVKHTTSRYDNEEHHRKKGGKATRTTAKREAVRRLIDGGKVTVGEVMAHGKAAGDILARYVRAGNYGVEGISKDTVFKLNHKADRTLADKLRRHKDKVITVIEVPKRLVK